MISKLVPLALGALLLTGCAKAADPQQDGYVKDQTIVPPLVMPDGRLGGEPTYRLLLEGNPTFSMDTAREQWISVDPRVYAACPEEAYYPECREGLDLTAPLTPATPAPTVTVTVTAEEEK